MASLLSQLSSDSSQLAAEAAKRLFHVPSPAGGRSALGFDGRRLLVPALEAEKGETVQVLAPGGAEVTSTVIGFDPQAGFAVLELAIPLPATAWTAETSLPALGSLVLALAFPSDEGPEARLDTVRIARGAAEGVDAYIQTDGSPFPGFGGGALVSPSGGLAGVIAADRSGNHGWALPALRAKELLEDIVRKGFPGRAWLGVSTLPVDVPAAWSALLDGREEAIMVAAVEEGSPASAAGLLPGDILASVAGKPLSSPEELREALASIEAGKPAALVLVRGGARKELSVTPGERPEGRGRGHASHGHHHPGEGHHHGHHRHGGKGHHQGGSGCGCGGSGGGDGGCGCSTGR